MVDADKLNKVLDSLLEGLERGGDFVAEQAPLVVQELLLWKRCWLTFGTAALTALAVAFFVFAVLACRRSYLAKEYSSARESWGFACLGSLVGGVASTVACGHTAYWCSMVWLAPRVYLIEYVRGLIKG